MQKPPGGKTVFGLDQNVAALLCYLPVMFVHLIISIAVIVQAEGTRFALLVDQLVGQHQVVVKNLETNYRKVPGISAATILGDGNVSLIIDVAAIQRTNRDKNSR